MEEETYGLLKQSYWSLLELLDKTRFHLSTKDYLYHMRTVESLREAIYKKGGIA